MDVLLQKLPNGCLAPTNDEDRDKFAKYKNGAMIKCAVSQMRNGRFHRKWFVLLGFGFGRWSETIPPQMYRGQPVQPNFNYFRKQVTVMAGHGHPVFSVAGEMRMEANSISWASMTDEIFEELYSATIDVLIHKILHDPSLSRASIDAAVERILSFDY